MFRNRFNATNVFFLIIGWLVLIAYPAPDIKTQLTYAAPAVILFLVCLPMFIRRTAKQLQPETALKEINDTPFFLVLALVCLPFSGGSGIAPISHFLIGGAAGLIYVVICIFLWRARTLIAHVLAYVVMVVAMIFWIDSLPEHHGSQLIPDGHVPQAICTFFVTWVFLITIFRKRVIRFCQLEDYVNS